MNNPKLALTMYFINNISPINIAYFEAINLNSSKIYFKINKSSYRNYMFILDVDIYYKDYNNPEIFKILYEYITSFKICDPKDIEEIFAGLIYQAPK
ncbi:hypothetical protein [Jeotgalibacillus alimentarius]|uniref:hypothetical protein n=1 Tax=Jeotgalibacillus alimentarius TaxID=135826 RepID=UPI00059725E3|nr:hypothetical protein [Jeotgalibacillus alimentarius]